MAAKWGPFGLDDRAAIVTGGARGIGRATAQRLSEAGASVLVVDVDAGAIDDAVAALRGTGANAVGMDADVTGDGAGEAIVARCAEAFGRVDVLVNNAGVYPMVPLSQVDVELIDRILRLNVTAALLLAKAAAHTMAAAGGGSIVNVASIDGVSPSSPGFVAYSASKGAVLAATRALAVELAPRAVRVNAVSPSGTMTEGVRAGLEALDPDTRRGAVASLTGRVPLGRMAEPDDIATVIAFFASDASRFVTGANLLVDGGQVRGPA